MDSNVSHLPPAPAADLLAHARPVEPDPTTLAGSQVPGMRLSSDLLGIKPARPRCIRCPR